ncbi:heavy metal transporter [Nakamurella sp.]|uniref:heavy metal transporter n=1 Tax=Nakamurella sp. TaxID=1869182 RepID=UPI0037850AF7
MRKPVKNSLIVAGVVCLLAAAVTAGLLIWRNPFADHPECTVPGVTVGTDAASPTVELTVAQLQHASTINAVGVSRGIAERGRIIAVATAYQESTLRNRENGDRDSVGLFQQRPSQGWGTKQEILDPIYAAGRFYDALLQVDDWPDLPLTQAAQKVQQSAYPDAYAKWEPQATTLVRALSGSAPIELGCRAGGHRPTAISPDRPAPAGTDDATPQLTAALAAADAELGGLTVQDVTDEGRTATVTASLAGLTPDAAGRTLAAWAVAHGTGMNITDVVVDQQLWTDHEWRTADQALGAGLARITVAP